MSYACARAGRRWFEEGSEIVRVQRVRIVVPDGSLKGRGSGIGLTILAGIAPVIVCVSASTEYFTVAVVSNGL